MKRTLFIVAFLLAGIVQAQRIKYKDLVPMLDSAREDEAIAMLIELLQTERDNPNANFRLGLLYVNKYKNTDPLKEFEKALEYANRTKLQMIKSKAVIDSREINRNGSWYAAAISNSGGNKVEFGFIQQLMDNEYNKADAFLRDTPPAYSSFTKAVLNYDKAKKTYAGIARDYTSLKELYLLFDQNLESTLYQLQNFYDSTHYYFNEYKTLKTGTIIKYNQQLVVKPVQVYRKDGLAIQTDFFEPEIEIWNYRQWSEKVINEVTTNIAGLRDALQNNYGKLAESVSAIKSGGKAEKFVSVDKQLLFNLGRLDYQNAIVPMLQYYQFLQGYDSRKQELSGLESDTAITNQIKLSLYTELLYQSIRADSILADLMEKGRNEEKLKRHEEFIRRNFEGFEGFNKMAIDERQKSEGEYSNYVNLIKRTVKEATVPAASSRESVTYQRMNIPLFISVNPLDSLQDNKPVTTIMELNPDGSQYLAGIVRRNAKTKLVEVFVSKIGQNRKVTWLKYFDLAIDEAKSPANHLPSAIRATAKGVLIAINSVKTDSVASVNSLVYLSDTGEELLSVRLSQKNLPRFINYQENTRSFVITCYNPKTVNGILEMLNVTDTGTVVWEKEMLFTGTLNQVLNVHEGIILAGTGTFWKSDRNELKNDQPALLIARMNLHGDILGEKMIAGFRLEKAYKVNDSNISLMSSLSAAEGPPGSTDFIITNSSLEMIFPRKE